MYKTGKSFSLKVVG